jgi:plastocyanin
LQTKQKRILIAAVAVAAAVGGGIVFLDGGDDDSPSSRSSADDVDTGAETFRYPRDVQGVAGEPTTFVNEDDVPHTVTSDDGLWDSETLPPGEEFTIDTLPAGTYPYHCSIHAELTGELEITG